ncbi:putative F-box protein PP2-B12 [Chenopodium quinoa]|uniref:F-box domain-containing protein n=1 Tax=Chenopodium quinoa TaxID=63459 RepID=A0A803M1A6_CHEQI|nr:putative F-box protein PP2-B12 [Chenopodium quinoa]
MSLSTTNFIDLPEECLSQILSLTTPTDVIRSSAVSKQFLSASESNFAWEKFIPLNCDRFIEHSSPQLVRDQQQQIVSKKELYFRLCRSPILLNNDCSKTGKKSYMLGARALEIAWGGTPQHWKYVPESRSLEIVELYTDYDECCLEIKGRIHTKFLSPDTTYAMYFVFKTDADDNHAYRFEHIPVMVSVFANSEEGLSKHYNHHRAVFKKFYLKASGRSLCRHPDELPEERADGWMEIEMGIFQVDSSVEAADEQMVLEMTLNEVQGIGWKSGLIVRGIELWPLIHT